MKICLKAKIVQLKRSLMSYLGYYSQTKQNRIANRMNQNASVDQDKPQIINADALFAWANKNKTRTALTVWIFESPIVLDSSMFDFRFELNQLVTLKKTKDKKPEEEKPKPKKIDEQPKEDESGAICSFLSI